MNRLVIFISILLFIIALVFLSLWPKYQDWRSLERRIREKEIELYYEGEHFSALEKISSELAESEAALSKIDSAIPQSPSLPGLFNFLQKTSSQEGLILKAMSPTSTYFSKEAPGIQETQFNLMVSGSYSSFKNFISVLEKSARFIRIDRISLSSPEQAEENSIFSFSLELKTYSY